MPYYLPDKFKGKTLGEINWWANLNRWKHTFEPGHETTCLMSYVNNKGADQPAPPRSLIRTFVVRCLDSIIPLLSISRISSLYLASVAEQAGLSLPCSQTPKTSFLVTGLICLQFLKIPDFEKLRAWNSGNTGETCSCHRTQFWNLRNTYWAASWQNQQNDCAPSENSDQLGHPPSLIRVFAVRTMGS